MYNSKYNRKFGGGVLKKIKNNVLLLLYTVILGSIVGAIIWTFLRIMNLGIEFIWNFIPSKIDFPLYTLFVCAAMGFLIGLWKKKFGDYPEELGTVLGKVKKTGRYPYNNIFSTIISALLPLVSGASIGPEAGLTGVIAGLCSWVGDKLKLYFKEVKELTQIGMSATLGSIFHSPLFGFIEPIESDKDVVLPKTSKIVLYFTAILSSFGVFILLGNLFGGKTGLESLGTEKVDLWQYLYAIPLAAIGILAGYLYFLFKKLTFSLEQKFKKYTIIRGAVGGLLLGISGTILPLTMFSGEHQMGVVISEAETIGAVMLIIIAVVKLLLTNICIDSGLKGGHFFPIIFCGISIGCAMSLIFGIDIVFSASIVTTALVGHTLKKPLATVLLLMIIFPVKLIPIMLFAAIAAKFIETPKFLLPKS